MDRFDKVVPFNRTFSSLGLILGIALGLAFSADSAFGQIPPGEDWRTLHTEHFRITYPEGLLQLAQTAGRRAETAWSALSEIFVDPPGKRVDMVLTDHIDISNGFSRVFPSNRIVIYAPPPLDGFGLPHMDEWLELVITHEIVHIFHEDYARNLGGFLRRIMGRVPLEWPFFPGSATPGWIVEGIATYYESELTQAGRVRGSFHEMVVRTAILEGGFESIDQSSGDSPIWPGGQRYYIYGSLFLKHLMDLHGEEAMGEFVEAVAGQWVPYRVNSAARDALGISFSEAWEDWEKGLEVRYSALRESLQERAPITEGDALTGEGYYAWNPEVSPDGRGVTFARSDGRSDAQIRFKDLESGQEEKLARTNNLSHFSWLPDGGIIFSQLTHTDSYRVRGDLFHLDPGGLVLQLTHGARLDHPHASPTGKRVVATQEGAGTNRLVLVELATGEVEPLTHFDEQTLWSYPQWSPDGRWIAASRWRPGAFYDVVILSREGTVLWEVTNDRGIDNSPSWSPDGRWLLWSSDRSGIPNLYAAAVDPESGRPGEARQISNVLGGAAYPVLDPGSGWIYYSAYHADGWRLERIPFRPDQWYEPFPLHPRFQSRADPERLQERLQTQGRPYSPFATLAPTFWAPAFREGDFSGDAEVLQSGYGLFTSGEDLVGRHAYTALGTFSSGVANFNGRASYSYGGLENPVLSLALSQSHDAGSRPFQVIVPAGDTIPVYLVEKEQVVGLGTSFFRRRSRTQTSLSISASHVWEERFLLEEDLQKSDQVQLARPKVRFAEARATLTFGNARRFAFSLGPEDGVGAVVRGRVRRDLTLADSLRDLTAWDRSYQDILGQVTLYKGLRGPGFGNHVLALRASGGLASGPGADAFHFEVGGASGSGVPLEFLDLGQGLVFPVRGYRTATRFGRYAWSGTFEYRFPIALVNRGLGLFPLHLDWIGGAVFLDAGNAWGPDGVGSNLENFRRDALASAGGELTVRTLPLWFQDLDLRVGLAFPLVGEEGPEAYLRMGISF